MQYVTNTFLDALRTNHNVVMRFEFYKPGVSGPIWSSTAMLTDSDQYLYVVDGTVSMDKKADIRSRLSMVLMDPTGEAIPTDADALLAPFTNEIKVYRGIQFYDGSVEYVLLGTWRLTDCDIDEADGGVRMTISGQDRARNVSRFVVERYYQPNIGDTYAEAIRAMILDRYPAVEFNGTAAQWNSMQNDQSVVIQALKRPTYTIGADLWKEARRLAAAIGCDLYFDRSGVCTMIRDPAFTYTSGVGAEPVFDFEDGDSAIFTGLKRKLSDSNRANEVIVTGEGTGLTGLPLRSTPAIDDDPTSPTYFYGSYGRVPKMETHDLLYTQIQVDDYAQLRLRQSLGAQELVSFPSLVAPHLDPDDIVSVTRSRLGLNKANYIIDTISIPLRAEGKMQTTLRERRALS